MNINTYPDYLLLLPVMSHGDAPPSYGMVELRKDVDFSFFDALRLYRDHAMALAKLGATASGVKDVLGKLTATTLYDEVRLLCGWCTFLHQCPDEDFEEDECFFKGVESFEGLLSCTAEDLLRRHSDVTADLMEDGFGDGRPVLINFRQWHQNIVAGGYAKCSIEEFWERIQNMAVHTVLDTLVVELPNVLPVLREGPPMQFGDMSHKVKFYFTATVDEGGLGDVLETKMLDISPFIGAFEDAFKSE